MLFPPPLMEEKHTALRLIISGHYLIVKGCGAGYWFTDACHNLATKCTIVSLTS